MRCSPGTSSAWITSTGNDPPRTRWLSQAAQDQDVEEGRVAARHIGKHLREDVMIGYLADGLLVSEYY